MNDSNELDNLENALEARAKELNAAGNVIESEFIFNELWELRNARIKFLAYISSCTALLTK